MEKEIKQRVDCVAETTRRNLNSRFNVTVKAARAKKIAVKDAAILRIHQLQQAVERKEMKYNEGIQERYEFECDVNQARRECEVAELAKQRRAYQQEERNQLEEKRKYEAQIHLFDVATRFKNEETNKRFLVQAKRRKDKEFSELQRVIFGQRDEFLERRYNELMRMSDCQVDETLQEDKLFFQDAVNAMVKARTEGRIMYPIAKAAEKYRKENQIDMVPEGRSVRRSKLRDYCWPGYHAKADFAYRNYQHREKCRELQHLDRHNIFANCVKITSMAAEENPYKPCELMCPVKCFQHRGVPAMDSVDSFDVCREVCYDEAPPVLTCPSNMQVVENCKPEMPPAKPLPITCSEDVVVVPSKQSTVLPELPFIAVLPTSNIAKKPSNDSQVSRGETLKSAKGIFKMGNKSATRVSSGGTLKSSRGIYEMGNKTTTSSKSVPIWR